VLGRFKSSIPLVPLASCGFDALFERLEVLDDDVDATAKFVELLATALVEVDDETYEKIREIHVQN